MDGNSPPLLENRYHQGDRPFYVGRHRTGAAFVPQRTLTRQHMHTGLETGGIAGGGGILVLDSREYPLKPGSVFFLDPMIPHETWGQDLDVIVAHLTRESVVSAHVDPGDVRLIEPFTGVRHGLCPVIEGAEPQVKALISAQTDYASRTQSGKQRSFLTVIGVIEALCERLEGDTAEWKRNGNLASRILQFIHENHMRECGMRDIAAFTGMSVSSVAHVFKDYTGLSPVQFRNQVRIAHALEMIKMTDQTMSSIALACGFNNTSQFYRMFRKITGSTPTQWTAATRGTAP